jgi:lysophospholipase L1-like esterase
MRRIMMGKTSLPRAKWAGLASGLLCVTMAALIVGVTVLVTSISGAARGTAMADESSPEFTITMPTASTPYPTNPTTGCPPFTGCGGDPGGGSGSATPTASDPGGGGGGGGGGTPPPVLPKYLAMGDSYASGTAAGNYYHSACYRSPNNYAYRVAGVIPPLVPQMDVNVVACHGAVIPNITGTYQGEPPQIDSVNSGLDLVTLSIGGNDLGFGPKLRQCMTGDCSGQPLVTQAQLDTVKANLVTLYKKIREKMRRDARLVVLTYPRLFPKLTDTHEVCPKIYNFIEWPEMVLIDDAWKEANFMLKSAVATARAAGTNVEMLDVLEAFDNKDICSDDPYGTSLVLSDTNESFHPNAAGHAKEAQMLSAFLDRTGGVGRKIGSLDPTPGWDQWDPLGGTVAGEVSTVALDDKRSMAFARRSDGTPMVNMLDGWSGWQALDGNITTSVNAVVRYGTVYISALGSDGRTPFIGKFSGTTWMGWQSLGGALLGPPALASPDISSVMAIGRGVDNSVYVNTNPLWDSGWRGWQGIGGTITTDPVASGSNQRVDVVATTNGDPFYNRFNTYSSAWTGWQYLGGKIVGRPAVVAIGNNVSFIAGRDANNTPIVDWFSDGWPGGWSGWQSLGGVFVGDPAITAVNGTVFVTGPGTDGRIHVQKRTSQWQGWAALGASNATGRVGITSGGTWFAEVVGVDSTSQAPYHLQIW